MSYAVKSIEKTIQGEGFHAGRVALFVRFAGCNLWSGLAEHRGEQGSCSAWCDTDFVGTDGANGGRYSVAELVGLCHDAWGPGLAGRFAVLTGGEPALQADSALVERLQAFGFEVAIETNGTREIPWGLDWITLSPKAGALVRLARADEIKLVHPQEGLRPGDLERIRASHRYLQPMDGPRFAENAAATVAYCLEHPEWRVSVQGHKILGVP